MSGGVKMLIDGAQLTPEMMKRTHEEFRVIAYFMMRHEPFVRDDAYFHTLFIYIHMTLEIPCLAVWQYVLNETEKLRRSYATA